MKKVCIFILFIALFSVSIVHAEDLSSEYGVASNYLYSCKYDFSSHNVCKSTYQAGSCNAVLFIYKDNLKTFVTMDGVRKDLSDGDVLFHGRNFSFESQHEDFSTKYVDCHQIYYLGHGDAFFFQTFPDSSASTIDGSVLQSNLSEEVSKGAKFEDTLHFSKILNDKKFGSLLNRTFQISLYYNSANERCMEVDGVFACVSKESGDDLIVGKRYYADSELFEVSFRLYSVDSDAIFGGNSFSSFQVSKLYYNVLPSSSSTSIIVRISPSEIKYEGGEAKIEQGEGSNGKLEDINENRNIESSSESNHSVQEINYDSSDDLSKNQLKSAFEVCTKPSYRKTMKIVGLVIKVVRIVVPLLILVMGIKDLYTAVVGNKEDTLFKAVKNIGVRLLAGVLIFLLSSIIQFLITLVSTWNDEGYQNHFSCCTDCALNFDCDKNSACNE
ncbi:MAG: hypothetical protein IJ743_02270 [Bacilli bacterium]|nr:hypothetical protein [Bacilli bacterium]